jgi:8-oxo-dGTP pyrophosphatase MutT (NUDIX family)
VDNFENVIATLKSGLQQPLPGASAQQKMAPIQPGQGRSRIVPAGVVPRKSGVLVLIYPKFDQAHLVLMLRPDYGGVHSGQVSFPGGKQETNDPTITHTALREAEEELGIRPDAVNVLGALSDLYIPPSNALVTPTVGFANERPNFRPDSREVAAVIEADLAHFLKLEVWKTIDMRVGKGVLRNTPYFALEHYKIWGATAMMLSELTALLNNFSEGS